MCIYTHSSFLIHHSAFTIRHSVLVIHHSAFMYVCMHAKKHTSLFAFYFYQKLIKNGIQSTPRRLPGPIELVILRCVLANLQKKLKHSYKTVTKTPRVETSLVEQFVKTLPVHYPSKTRTKIFYTFGSCDF